MILGLIGMSGIGKTAWANRFEQAGFSCFHCDDMIAERLQADGLAEAANVDDVGRWMGFPWSAGYQQREAQYLRYENEVLSEIVASIEQNQIHKTQLVIDMTGSAIYVEPELRQAIKRYATVVYLASSPAQHKAMRLAYQAKPRPIIWNTIYQPKPGESSQDTLARCYVELLQTRSDLYAAFADITLAYAMHQDPKLSVADFVGHVKLARNTIKEQQDAKNDSRRT